MKTLFMTVAAASLMLGACSHFKKDEPQAAPQISVEEALAQCKQASDSNTDRAAFDACMKDKGFQRKADAQPSAEAAPAVEASAPAAK